MVGWLDIASAVKLHGCWLPLGHLSFRVNVENSTRNKTDYRFSIGQSDSAFSYQRRAFHSPNDLADQRFVLARVGGDQPAAVASYEIDESGGNGTPSF